MSYRIKEIFYSLQGEGAHTGRAAVFCRFAGCNLWSGHDGDRAGSICTFCDTDFVGTDGTGGGTFESAWGLADAVAVFLPVCRSSAVRPWVVCTGGEPLLQLDDALIAAFHDRGFTVAVETNGTRPVPTGLDWITVSPKAGADLAMRTGDELKLVYPQAGLDPETLADLDFRHFFLQPMAGALLEQNTRQAIQYCLNHPQWRLSLQAHKILGIR